MKDHGLYKEDCFYYNSKFCKMKVSKIEAHLIFQDMRLSHCGDVDESNHIRYQAVTTDMVTSIARDGIVMKRINALQVLLCSLLPSVAFLWSEESGEGKIAREEKRVCQ
jgi:hypothetical protein